MRELIVHTDTLGRFGNSLFGIANCIRLGLENDYDKILFTNCVLDIYDRKTILSRKEIILKKEMKRNDKIKHIKRRSLGLYDTTYLGKEIYLYKMIFDKYIHNLYSLNNNMCLYDDNVLTIHIRSEDIFSPKMLKERNNRQPIKYTQPPLCFYEHIIDNSNFDKIRLVTTKDKNNPVITQLEKRYKNKILFQCDTLANDFNILINCSNLVLSSSSFAYTSMLLNKNLKNLYVFKTKYFFDFDTNVSFSGVINTIDHMYYAKNRYIEDWDPGNIDLYDIMVNYSIDNLNYVKYIN